MKQEPNVGGTSGFEDNKTLVNHIVVGSNTTAAVVAAAAAATTTAVGGSCSGVNSSNVGTNMSVELCLVCGDRASGRHYGAISCEGCKGFFKRSIRKQLGYQCRGTMNCEVTKHHRNRCQFCRLQKCLASGMRSDSVQHERKPIVDKKETIGGNNATNTSNISSGNNVKSTSPVYQQRSNKSIFNHNLNATTTSNANTTPGFSLGSNMSGTGIFPMGFNFAELTQTLMLASQQQQQQQQQQHQQQQQQLATQTTASTTTTAAVPQPPPPLCYSPDIKNHIDDDDDEDSMDNSSTICLQNLSNTATNNNSQNLNFNIDNLTNPANAVNMIQTSLDKCAIDKAMQILTPIQLELERIGSVSGGGVSCNQTTTNSNNNMTGNVLHIKNELDTDMNCTDIGSSGIGIGIGGIDNGDEDNEQMHIDDPTNELNTNEPFIINENIFNNELITAQQVSFNLQPPNLVTSYLNLHYVCETGSRSVFLSIFWLRKIQAFEQLDTVTQIKLVRHAWPGLLAIALAQTRSLSIKTIISTLINNISQLSEMEKIEVQKIRKLSEQTARLYGFIREMHNMDLTDMEYALMRLTLVFNPIILTQRKERLVRQFVKRIQNYTLNTLRKHIVNKLKTNLDTDERYNGFIMNLMPLFALDSDHIEELFFTNLVGQVQIDNMIPYLLVLSAG